MPAIYPTASQPTAGTGLTSLDTTPRYWLGVNTNWSDTTNWAVEDGGTGGFAVPTANNNVHFTSTNVGNCTLTANAECESIYIEDGYTGTFSGATFDMYVAGDVRFRCTGGTVVLGTGDWLIDGDFDAHDCGTFTYTGSTIEMTGVASPTVYIHQFNSFSNRLGSVVISAGANVQIGSLGTYSLWHGDVDIYGTLTIPVSKQVGTSIATFTVYSGGTLTGLGTLGLTPGNIVVESGGTMDIEYVAARYGCNVRGIIDSASFSWGNSAVATDYTLVFTGDTTIYGKFTLVWNQAANTATIDLNTNAAEVKLADDVDFTTDFSTGTLVIDDAAGKFKLIGSADQNIDFGGKTVNLWANKWVDTATVTFGNASDHIDLVNDSVFGVLVLDGAYLDGNGYDVDLKTLTLTSGTWYPRTGSTWTATGNVTVDASAVTMYCSGSTLVFNNTTTQNWICTGANVTFGNIILGANSQVYITNEDGYVAVNDIFIPGILFFKTADGNDGRIFVYGTLTLSTSYGRMQEYTSGYYGKIIMSGASADIVFDNVSSVAMRPSVLSFYNTNLELPGGYYRVNDTIEIYNGAGVDTIVTAEAGAYHMLYGNIKYNNYGGAGDVCKIDTTGSTRFRFYGGISPSSANKAECHLVGDVELYSVSLSTNNTVDLDTFGTIPTSFRLYYIHGSLTLQNIADIVLDFGVNYVYNLTVASTVPEFDIDSAYLYCRGGTVDFNCPILTLGSRYVYLYDGADFDVQGVTTLNGETCLIRAAIGSSTITVGAMSIHPTFYRVEVRPNATLTFGDTSKEVTFSRIYVYASGTLTNNISSRDLRTFECIIQGDGVINGVGSLYLSRSLATHPVQTYVGDPGQLQCTHVKFYCTGGYNMTVPSGTYDGMVNMIFWCSSANFIFAGNTTAKPSSLLQFRHLSSSNTLIDLATNGAELQVVCPSISLSDDSSGALDCNGPIKLVGTADQTITDNRDIASVTYPVEFSSAKTSGGVTINGSNPVVLTDIFNCGSLTTSSAGDIDFNDATVNCSGDLTLINTPDLGSAIITVGGHVNLYNTTDISYGTSTIIMTGVDKSLRFSSANKYLKNITIAEGADITCDSATSGFFEQNDAILIISGHLTVAGNLSSYIYKTNVYVTETGRWSLTGTTFTMIYYPGSGKGVMQQDGIIDGTRGLYFRGSVSDSVCAPGTYDVPIVAYSAGVATYVPLNGIYNFTHAEGIVLYPDATHSSTFTFAADSEITVSTIKFSSSAGADNGNLAFNDCDVYLSGDMDLDNGVSGFSVSATSGFNLHLIGSSNQAIDLVGEDIGNIILEKADGDVTITNTISKLSGTSGGGVTVE